MTDEEIDARFAAISARIVAIEEALIRVAAYLGVAHVLKDPRV